MGYKRQRKTLSLRFEDEPGLEVLARSVSLRKFLDILEGVDRLTSSPKREDVEGLFKEFAERVISWNLEDEDDKPVPVGADAILDEDLDFGVKLLMGWVAGILKMFRLPGVEGFPPAGDSAGNPPSSQMEESIPMTPASVSGM